jgi:hypothetical protein
VIDLRVSALEEWERSAALVEYAPGLTDGCADRTPPRTGYQGFSNDELHQAMVEWKEDAPPSGSRAERAMNKASTEVERRRVSRTSPRAAP